MSDEKEFCKDVFGNSIQMPPLEQVKANEANLEKLLLDVGEYTGWDGDLSEVFVSDLSVMQHFCLEPEEIEAISKKLGVSIAEEDYLFEIAKRMGAN